MPNEPSTQANEAQLRQRLANAYTLARSLSTMEGLGAMSMEEVISEQIVFLDGSETGDLGRLQEIEEIERDLALALEAARNLGPSVS